MEGGKPEYPVPEKNPRSRDKNQEQTQPTYDAWWWEASALTTAPFLLPLTFKSRETVVAEFKANNALYNESALAQLKMS